jgi:hypothetical protein
MATPIFTPKKAQILVPGAGVVAKADFTQKHAETLLKAASGNGVDQEKFIKQHFDVSFGDLPLFDDEASAASAEADKLKAEKAEYEKLLAEEEAAKKATESKKKSDKASE